MHFLSQWTDCARLRIAGLAAGAMLAAGCQGPPCHDSPAGGAFRSVSSVDRPASQQLMIKFKHARRSCDASDISALAAASGEALTYIRPMSGNACVVSHAAKDKGLLQDGIRRLASHHAVEWAEVDAILRIN